MYGINLYVMDLNEFLGMWNDNCKIYMLWIKEKWMLILFESILLLLVILVEES